MSPTTSQSYSKHIRRFRNWQSSHPEVPLYDQVVTFLGTLPPSTWRNGRNALRFALGHGALSWDELPRPRHSRDVPRLRAGMLTPTDRAAIAQHPRLTDRQRLALLLGYVCRRFEIASLRWEHLDLAAGTITVHRGKGGKTASTLLPVPTLDLLRRLARPSGYLFPGRSPDEPMTPDGIGTLIRRALRRTGLYRPYRGAHAFRRTFADEFLRQYPGEIRQLQELMRHANMGTTALYVYPTLDDLRQPVQQLRL